MAQLSINARVKDWRMSGLHFLIQLVQPLRGHQFLWVARRKQIHRHLKFQAPRQPSTALTLIERTTCGQFDQFLNGFAKVITLDLEHYKLLSI